MPSRLIFDSSVCRGIPSFAAAPEGPGYAAMGLRESRFDHLDFTIGQRRKPLRAKAGDSAGSAFSQLSSTAKVSVSARMTARSTTFCNSRMLPGQG